MTNERRERVKIVREEGRAAAQAGKNRQAKPYSTYDSDRFQWFTGYELFVISKPELETEIKINRFKEFSFCPFCGHKYSPEQTCNFENIEDVLRSCVGNPEEKG